MRTFYVYAIFLNVSRKGTHLVRSRGKIDMVDLSTNSMTFDQFFMLHDFSISFSRFSSLCGNPDVSYHCYQCGLSIPVSSHLNPGVSHLVLCSRPPLTRVKLCTKTPVYVYGSVKGNKGVLVLDFGTTKVPVHAVTPEQRGTRLQGWIRNGVFSDNKKVYS